MLLTLTDVRCEQRGAVPAGPGHRGASCGLRGQIPQPRALRPAPGQPAALGARREAAGAHSAGTFPRNGSLFLRKTRCFKN